MRRSLYAHRLIRGEPAQAGDLLRRRVREVLAAASNGVLLPDGALRVHDVDGVLSVDREDLDWEVDDIALTVPIM